MHQELQRRSLKTGMFHEPRATSLRKMAELVEEELGPAHPVAMGLRLEAVRTHRRRWRLHMAQQHLWAAIHDRDKKETA